MHGIWSALSEEHGQLPIIDVTHAAFQVHAPESTLEALSRDFVDPSARQTLSPEARVALGRSVLGRALAAASGTYLSGMSTYLMKLGPENLWQGPTAIDRKIAASFPALASRIRLQDMAQMLAEHLGELLYAKPGCPICMLNIAGGVAADSWNALLCLKAQAACRLDGREIRIAVLDQDERGPEFGARVIEALQMPGAPLHGLQIDFSATRYDWSEPNRLAEVLQEFGTEDAAFAASSEGGLFEYGTDEEIVANLTVLHANTPPDTFVVGSVTRDCEAVKANGPIVATRPRTLDAFRALAERGGWELIQAIERPFSFHVALVKNLNPRLGKNIPDGDLNSDRWSKP